MMLVHFSSHHGDQNCGGVIIGSWAPYPILFVIFYFSPRFHCVFFQFGPDFLEVLLQFYTCQTNQFGTENDTAFDPCGKGALANVLGDSPSTTQICFYLPHVQNRRCQGNAFSCRCKRLACQSFADKEPILASKAISLKQVLICLPLRGDQPPWLSNVSLFTSHDSLRC